MADLSVPISSAPSFPLLSSGAPDPRYIMPASNGGLGQGAVQTGGWNAFMDANAKYSAENLPQAPMAQGDSSGTQNSTAAALKKILGQAAAPQARPNQNYSVFAAPAQAQEQRSPPQQPTGRGLFEALKAVFGNGQGNNTASLQAPVVASQNAMNAIQQGKQSGFFDSSPVGVITGQNKNVVPQQ